MILSDQRVRDRIRNDLDTTLVIEAAAGTGKTTALVSRIVAVVAAGRTELSRVVAVTFTEKAAGELKLRLRAEIERARHDPALGAAERSRLRAAIPALEEARIGTIHSFCADLLRERPVQARVDPMFEVAPEEVADALFEQAFERWFAQALASPGEGMRRLLRRRDFGEGEGPRAVARAAADALSQWRDLDAAWEPYPFERDREIDALVREIEALAALGAKADPGDYLARALGEISRPLAEATRLESVRGRDYDALEQVLAGLLRGNHNRRFGWRGFGDTFAARPRAEVLAERDALRERLIRFREEAGANLAPMIRDELWPVVGYYQELKRRAGVLDFLDLLLVARSLVRDDAAVRAELQVRFSHVFVDEFQDTDPLQAEILILLCADSPDESDWRRVRPVAGKLFIVGDPKQSIYRFRRADVSLYQELKRRLHDHGAAIEHLTVSFRGTPELQEMVNAAVAPLMAAESDTQPAYVALERFREGVETQPSVVVLPVPAPYGDYGKVVEWKIEQSLPDAVAAFVKWMVADSGWTVTERDHPERRIALSPRHVCILFRRLNAFGRDVTRPYVRALEARHIPHVLVKGGSFNEREEIEAARNLLGAIERPDDELLVFVAMHGPVFAFSDAALLEFRETIGSLHPFRKISAAARPHLQEIGRALGLLRDLHRGRNRRPIADTLARLLCATRAHAGFAIWPTGEQALANLMRLGDMARRYEARGGATSFRGFVDELEARAEREQASEVPVVEEGAEGVRIMTVHRAKGLEFPAVILADITCKDIAPEPARFVLPARRLSAQRLAGCAPRELTEHSEDEARRDREEAARLLYVAATRARDLLVVPAVGDDGFDPDSAGNSDTGARQGWLAGLDRAIFPAVEERRNPLATRPAGCPQFGDDSASLRPEADPAQGKKAAPLKERSVAPGLHRARAGAHHVVWWDPKKLELDVAETMGLRQMQLLKADAEKTVSRRGIEAWERWRDGIETLLEKGSTPQFIVNTATELTAEKSAAADGEEDAIEIVEAAREAVRPHGQRFGALVHLVMLRVGLGAADAEVLTVAAGAGRILGAEPDEIEAAARAVTRALQSPLMERVRESAEVRRECPVLLAPGDGPVVEGVVDVAFLERGESAPVWTVVDFKTDLDLAGRVAEYRRQVALYVRAIAAATGMPARGLLFWI